MANAWGGGEGCSELWITEYHSFLQTTGARERIPHFLQELQLAQQHWIEEDVDEQQSEYQDEWMVLCQRNPRFRVHSEQDDQVDWEAAARDFPREMLRECPNWIISQCHLSKVSSNSTWHGQLPAVDVTSLNSKQKHAYDLIQDYHVRFLSAGTTDPLHMIVSGTAGTGKSYLISAIAHLRKDTCILTGTTGMASFSICGKTLHSALQLPVHANNQQELQGAALQQLQIRLKDKHYLIIDEMSMIEQRMLA